MYVSRRVLSCWANSGIDVLYIELAFYLLSTAFSKYFRASTSPTSFPYVLPSLATLYISGLLGLEWFQSIAWRFGSLLVTLRLQQISLKFSYEVANHSQRAKPRPPNPQRVLRMGTHLKQITSRPQSRGIRNSLPMSWWSLLCWFGFRTELSRKSQIYIYRMRRVIIGLRLVDCLPACLLLLYRRWLGFTWPGSWF